MDIFDELIECAEPRHKEWNKVFAKILRGMYTRMEFIESKIDKMESLR
jgi:hypothetical protein